MTRFARKLVEMRSADRYVGGVLPRFDVDKRRGTATPPAVPEIAERLGEICRRHGITRLEIFGSVARGEATVGSDVDLIARFRKMPGLEFVDVIEEMERSLGVPVDLLTTEDVEESDNPFRKALINRDRRTIYVGG
jgi:predicted nucleotidyltransferase